MNDKRNDPGRRPWGFRKELHNKFKVRTLRSGSQRDTLQLENGSQEYDIKVADRGLPLESLSQAVNHRICNERISHVLGTGDRAVNKLTHSCGFRG